jgi:hypothetical protein
MKYKYVILKIKLFSIDLQNTKFGICGGDSTSVIQSFDSEQECVDALNLLKKGTFEPNRYFIWLPFELED